MMTLPHFLMIGAAKSGTVSLYNYLNQHPQIYMSPINETNFFALVGMDVAKHFHGPTDREAVEQICITNLGDYKALFAAASPEQCVGEASPLYLYSPAAAAQIKRYIPAVKLIVVLRQPAERAFSNYRHYRRVNLEPLADFSAALAAESDRMEQGWGPWPFWHYKQMGFYAQQLARYYDIFDRDQLMVCLYDDLQQNSLGLVQQIFAFLGVDAAFEPNVAVKHNMGGQPRHQTLFRLMTRPNWLKKGVNALLPLSWRLRLRDRIHTWNVDVPALDSAVRQHLNHLYREDIGQLQKMIGRDLSHWLV